MIGLLIISGCGEPRSPEPAARRQPAATSARDSQVTELPSPPFRNMALDVAYVGNDACLECHEREHASYARTSHSQALQPVRLENEPPDDEFRHVASGRSYRVFRTADKMWHEESIVSEGNRKVVLAQFSMRYAIGSGNNSRSYLADIGGFLVESPVTWYRATGKWGMSPGFDRPAHSGFQRTADLGCLCCHAGLVQPQQDNPFRVHLHQLSIGCESCHGPGALHVARHVESATTGSPAPRSETGERLSDRPGASPPGAASQRQADGKRAGVEIDDTIVNPRHLTRDQAESICANCHLRGDATTLVSGRRLNDFRPGRRLTDFRVDYFLERSDHSMKVVGHVEQLRLSRCYQSSPAMTCTTCHDPHTPPDEESGVEHFRQRCLRCHETRGCGLPQDQRIARAPADNCAACHMPAGDTDIAHFAFHDHRIGIRREETARAAPPDDGSGRLVPAADLSHLSESERQRSLGLAYLEWSAKQASAPARARYRQHSLRLLLPLAHAGDAEVSAALARMAWEDSDFVKAKEYALAALRQEQPTPNANAMFVLSDIHLQQGDVRSALPLLQRLVQQRRVCDDWISLATCQQSLGDLAAATRSLATAAEIDPTRAELWTVLMGLYERSGQTGLAQQCRERRRALHLLALPPPR